jgi:hypothetical protein
MNGLVSTEALYELLKAQTELQRAISRVQREAAVNVHEVFRGGAQVDLYKLLAIIGQPEVQSETVAPLCGDLPADASRCNKFLVSPISSDNGTCRLHAGHEGTHVTEDGRWFRS